MRLDTPFAIRLSLFAFPFATRVSRGERSQNHAAARAGRTGVSRDRIVGLTHCKERKAKSKRRRARVIRNVWNVPSPPRAGPAPGNRVRVAVRGGIAPASHLAGRKRATALQQG